MALCRRFCLVFSECPLFFATLLTLVRHPNLPLSGCDAIKRAALCALALDTRLALRNGDGFAGRVPRQRTCWLAIVHDASTNQHSSAAQPSRRPPANHAIFVT